MFLKLFCMSVDVLKSVNTVYHNVVLDVFYGEYCIWHQMAILRRI